MATQESIPPTVAEPSAPPDNIVPIRPPPSIPEIADGIANKALRAAFSELLETVANTHTKGRLDTVFDAFYQAVEARIEWMKRTTGLDDPANWLETPKIRRAERAKRRAERAVARRRAKIRLVINNAALSQKPVALPEG
jgi:hypothetical protein